MIQVLNMIYGGERFSWDGHQLVDKGKHLPGFLLDKSGMLKASGVEISGRIDAMLGRLQHVNILEHAIIDGDITIKSGKFEVVSDTETERFYNNIAALILRTRIASDFNISVSDTYSVSHGVYHLSPFPEFDTIVFTANGGLLSFYKNGSLMPIPGTSPPINGIGSAGITIKMGSTDKVMVYDAPGSTTKQNVVYKTPDGTSNFDLKVKG